MMNGIDFFKACTTNVRAIENLIDLQYIIYSSKQGWNKESKLEHAVAELRERNILCATVKEELCIFALLDDVSEAEDEAQSYDFLSQKTSWADFDATGKVSGNRSIRDTLLDAIDGSIAYSLARKHNVMHIGDFSWLFSGSGGQDMEPMNSMLLQLDVKITEHSPLYVSTKTTHSHLRTLNRPEHYVGAQILLAPSGRRAKLVTESSGDEIVLRKPTSALQSNPTWTSKVSKAMLTEGVTLHADDEWLVLELVEAGKHTRFLWPQRLCYTSEKEPYSWDSSPSPSQGWKQWFGDTGSPDTFKNPLAEAEEWLMGAAERERLTNAASQSAGLPFESSLPHPANMIAETPLATSPPFNQRLMDQQAAMSGIYPTPPDGLIPGHLTQQPTSDGTGAGMQAEHSALSNELQLPSSDDNQMGGSSMESSGEAQAFQPNSDDLFGDMAEMDFGANEVGDADFDYFDEPDELPEATPAEPDVEMAEGGSSMQNKDDTEAKTQDVLMSDPDAMVTDELAVPDSRPTSSHDQTGDQVETEQNQSQEVEAVVSSFLSPPQQPRREPEKPLSPWGIRRQLLPMIPASAVSAEATQPPVNRRNSDYGPIAFNENLDLASKYAQSRQVDFAQSAVLDAKPNIALPQKRKQTRSKPALDPDSGVTDLDSSSDDDSDASSTSMSQGEDLPPRLPWDTKKRKRSSWYEQAAPTANASHSLWPVDDVGDAAGTEFDTGTMSDMLHTLLDNRISISDETLSPANNSTSALATLPPLEDSFELSKMDLIYVAQIVAEQAVSSIPGILESFTHTSHPDTSGTLASALEALMVSTTERMLPAVDDCDISTLALVKELPQRPTMNPGKAPQTSQPRPLQREASMQSGPDYFALPTPFIRVQRGTETWEMLPTALSFWSALGLGPANGAKDVAPVVVKPGNQDLVDLVKDFVRDLGGMYESRKLGSFAKTQDIDKALNGVDAYGNGCVIASADEESTSVMTALKSFAEVCEDIGESLASVGHLDPERTIAILMVDPFEDEAVQPYLSACFWKLCQAYRQHTPKAHLRSPRSDLVLQILPVSLIASPDRLIILDAQQMGCLATEIYDRCPPSSKAAMAMDTPAALPILAAQAVELASVPPRKIAFQLASDPPTDLLNEYSILHLAYAVSAEKQWMSASWTDNTGKYQMAVSGSVRGKCFAVVAADFWERTLDIISARDVTWRVFIATDTEIDKSYAKCWRSIVASKPRRQALHVTLISVETETSLQLTPPSALETSNTPGTSGQFLTPGSTPQGTMTVSPDASGQAAPLTPAPADTATNPGENDPDAHLIDITDESWAMLLSPTFTSASDEATSNPATRTNNATPAIARGILFRRGAGHASTPPAKLESLGVNIHWDIRIRPHGTVDEGQPKQAEGTMREVLRMYRHLGLLGRARNLHVPNKNVGAGNVSQMLPVHIASASRAAEALGWFRVGG